MNSKTRRLWPVCFMFGLLAVMQAVVASNISPQQLVQDTSTRMLDAIRAEQAAIEENPDRLYELVDEIVLPYFDFRKMSQWVLGRNWRSAESAQREQFVVEFRKLLVRTYSTALSAYADEKISYLSTDMLKDGRIAMVRTEIEQAGTKIPITYSMYSSRDGWKVYDVVISGVSLVTNYSASFNSVIRKDGIDTLIRQLQQKNGNRTDG